MDQIPLYIRQRYVELFSICHNHSILAAWNPPFWKAWISEEDSVKLVGTISDEEITSGLWSLKAFKAPGPNGLHLGFFQQFWLLVGASIRDEVKQIFATSKMPEYLNQTLITLVPKCNNLESFNNYHPISLCNTIYKLVSKILVARIRPLLADLVSPFQTAFVPGRKGVDNAIIVQEIIHTMSKKKGRGGLMAIKIDLEKAYERFEWSFIRDTLSLFNFPS